MRWTDEDGSAHSKSFRGDSAEDDAREWIAAQRGDSDTELPECDGSASSWRSGLAELGARVIKSVRDGADPLQCGRVYASLAIAAGKHVDLAEVEERVAKIEEQDRKVDAQRKHGPRAGKQNRPTREAPKPGTALC